MLPVGFSSVASAVDIIYLQIKSVSFALIQVTSSFQTDMVRVLLKPWQSFWLLSKQLFPVVGSNNSSSPGAKVLTSPIIWWSQTFDTNSVSYYFIPATMSSRELSGNARLMSDDDAAEYPFSKRSRHVSSSPDCSMQVDYTSMETPQLPSRDEVLLQVRGNMFAICRNRIAKIGQICLTRIHFTLLDCPLVCTDDRTERC